MLIRESWLRFAFCLAGGRCAGRWTRERGPRDGGAAGRVQRNRLRTLFLSFFGVTQERARHETR